MNPRRLGAWLELLRISNSPTLVSNALTGCAIGVVPHAAYPWRAFAFAAPALVLVYVAGMATNDAVDAALDRAERPNRPIPSGRISRAAALVFAALASLAALGLLAFTGWPAVAGGGVLVLCALLYNLTHRLHPASILLMAACRALAIITAASAAGWPLEWNRVGVFAGVLAAYVVALSLIARSEAGSRARIRVVVAMVCAISLLDAAFLLTLDRWPQALAAGACFLTAALAQRRILGT